MLDRIKSFSAGTWAAILLLVSAVISASILLRGALSAGGVVELICRVFLAVILFKQTRSWVYVIPFALLTVCAFLSGATTLGVVGGAVSNGLLALYAAALFTEKLPALRPLARSAWFLPAAVSLGAYLVVWIGWLTQNAQSAVSLRTGLIFRLFLALALLLIGRWFADE